MASHDSPDGPAPAASPRVAPGASAGPAQPQPDSGSTFQMSRGAVRVLKGVATAMGLVILAPIALSSQDLYRWAASARGLDLSDLWPLLVPVALDLAAAACIGMVIVSAWRRDRPGLFGLLVWVFAGVSAYAQYTHGIAERDAGRAQDAWWAMPALALLGPLLLEVTLHRLRKWLRQDSEEILTGAAGFGVRWLVAPWSTLSAWAVSRREGIATAPAALAHIRDRKALAGMPNVDALHYAFGALNVVDGHAARVWLATRGVQVTQASINFALAAVSTPAPQSAIEIVSIPVNPPATSRPVPPTDAQAPRPTRARPADAKRQSPDKARVIAAAARTPNATDEAIAAKLGLSVSTVRRYRPAPGINLTPETGADTKPEIDTDESADTAPELDLLRV